MARDPGGFYSFPELVARGDCRNRTDLWRKQRDCGFPPTVKLNKRQAGWPRRAVHQWERDCIELSMKADAEKEAAEAPKPRAKAAKRKAKMKQAAMELQAAE